MAIPHAIRTPPGAIVGLEKRRYSGPEFVQALTDAELETMLGLVKASDAAAVIYERIKLSGMDFNTPAHVALVARMVNVNILTGARRDALIG